MKKMSSILLTALSLFSLRAMSAQAAAPEKVRVCIPVFREEFLSLAAMEAQDRGFFAAHGLAVDFQVKSDEKNPPSPVLENGELAPRTLSDFQVADTVGNSPSTCQFGTSNIERFLVHEDQAQKRTQPLLLSFYGDTYDTQLVVAANSKIKTVADLKGKLVRLGQPPVRVAMEKILAEAGLKISDIRQNYSVSSTSVLSELESGRLDAAVTYVPTMPYMLASGKVRVLKANIVKNYLNVRVPHSLVIANRAFAKKSPDVVRRFVAALQDSISYLRRNPSEAIFVLQRNSSKLGHGAWPVDKAIAEKAGQFVGTINSIELFSAAVPVRMQTWKDLKAYDELLHSDGIVKGKVNLAGWLGVSSGAERVSSL